MENLRLEITLNTYKITRIRKLQYLNPIIILQKKFFIFFFSIDKINFSEKIYVLKLFKLINYYVIKNLIFMFPINFTRFRINIFNYIKMTKILHKSKNKLLLCQINKNFKFFLLSKSKFLSHI